MITYIVGTCYSYYSRLLHTEEKYTDMLSNISAGFILDLTRHIVVRCPPNQPAL